MIGREGGKVRARQEPAAPIYERDENEKESYLQ